MTVGDIVRVVAPGATYSTYSDLFEELGFFNRTINNSFKEDTIAQIFATKSENGNKLFAIRDREGNESLIGERGIVRVSFEPRRHSPITISDSYTAIVTSEDIRVGCQTITKTTFLKIVDAAKKHGLI
jgi:hypothetical protein